MELEKAWDAVAFQAQGLAAQLSPKDAYTLLCAMASGKALARHDGALQALLDVLQTRGVGALGPRKVVILWTTLDRADSVVASPDALPATADFFRTELARALPRASGLDVAATETEEACTPVLAEAAPRPPRGSDAEWRRLHALLAASGCGQGDLRPAWEQLEAVTIDDPGAVRALSVEGLIAAARAAVLAPQRTGVTAPSDDFSQRLRQRLVEQARWMDGWAVSHAALAAAVLGGEPGHCYDPLRQTLLERCSLEPTSSAFSRGLGAREMSRLAEAERVAGALAALQVHDKVIREHLAAWLLRPLPPKRFARLAGNLAQAGLDGSHAKVGRHVRARARSSEVVSAVGDEVAAGLLRDYAQPES